MSNFSTGSSKIQAYYLAQRFYLIMKLSEDLYM